MSDIFFVGGVEDVRRGEGATSVEAIDSEENEAFRFTEEDCDSLIGFVCGEGRVPGVRLRSLRGVTLEVEL